MPNAIEDALARASAQQREEALKVIEEARSKIRLVSLQENELSVSGADAITRNAQIIEDAKRSIPFETMKDVDSISAPLPTPVTNSRYNANVIEINPDTKDNIARIEQGGGNNYLQDNAVDRAINRQAYEPPQWEQEQRAMAR